MAPYFSSSQIMVDAYQDITIPFQLSSVEFFTEVQRHLKPGGVMVVNLNMTSTQDGSINRYLCDTMASVFTHTYTVRAVQHQHGGILHRFRYAAPDS